MMEREDLFPYRGDPALAAAVLRALHRVVDPELAVDIVELGLVYGVEASAHEVCVRMTMTSAACPVAEVIMDEVHAELDKALEGAARIRVELSWDPPWSPERMSPRARRALEGAA
jgi:metal-sulfur cluster biosynthetic enzyme